MQKKPFKKKFQRWKTAYFKALEPTSKEQKRREREWKAVARTKIFLG